MDKPQEQAPGKIVDEAFNDYIRLSNAKVHGKATDEQVESARRRYAKVLAEYVLGGDPEWYLKGGVT